MTSATSVPPLRIAIVGPGKIGSIFAAQLARVGHHDVTVVARPESPRLAQLLRDGGIIDVKGERTAVRVLHALDEETPYDLVIVTLLDRQTDAVLSSLQRTDLTAEDLRRAARTSKSVSQARRCLAIASVLEGHRRGTAAEAAGMQR